MTTAHAKLDTARKAKFDEFYTQYADIEQEISAYLEYNPDTFRDKTVLLPCDDPEYSEFTKFFVQNFHRFGLRKLMSTSYAPDSSTHTDKHQPGLFDLALLQYVEKKPVRNGKIFTMTRSKSDNSRIDIDDLKWNYLDGDGDFRSHEIKQLRDESDVVVTNPPFSLFRDFFSWIVGADKKFLIMGNLNAVCYSVVFPFIKENKIRLGATIKNGDVIFKVPADYIYRDSYTGLKEQNGEKVCRFASVRWFTNLEHGRDNPPLRLMTMADNLEFSKHKKIKGKESYEVYQNYDAIEVPFVDSIPSDFDGVMGVPITFIDKYSAEQFEILGICENLDLYGLKTKQYSSAECKQAYLDKYGRVGTENLNVSGVLDRDGVLVNTYERILIKHKKKHLDKYGKEGTYDLNVSGVLDRDGVLVNTYRRILIKHKKKNRPGVVNSARLAECSFVEWTGMAL